MGCHTGKFYVIFLRRSSVTAVVKELLKSVCLRQSYCKSKSGTFFWPTVYVLNYVLVCIYTVQAVEDFHAQISNVAATLLDEFRLALHYSLQRGSTISATNHDQDGHNHGGQRHNFVKFIQRCPMDFYRAMHFSAKRGLTITCRPSVCL